MTFNSPEFILFFTAVLLGWYLLPGRARRPFLLLAGGVFYWLALPEGWYYLALLAGTSALCWLAGRYLGRAESQKVRRLTLAGMLVLLFGVLFGFKYTGFVLSLAGAGGSLGWLVPVGLSFYTFQAAGYLIDVYNRAVEPEQSLLTFMLFLSFFPQILSGPINRAKELLPQFRDPQPFDYHTVVTGGQRFLTGLFKKVVLADGLAVLVDGVYESLAEYMGLTLWLAVLFYALQLYFDFSGYSDMAIGAARMLGFTMRENFQAPYFAPNFSVFWKRWHMSLTGWFNDYLFTPLVWSRWVNKLAFGRSWEEHRPHFALNILIVFTLSGLWHGAGLTFLVWGVLNGLFRVAEEGLHRLRPPKKRAQAAPAVLWLKRAGVFVLFALSLVFFRASNLAQAVDVFRGLCRWAPLPVVLEQILHLASNGISTAGLYMTVYWGTLLVGLALVFFFDRRIDRSLGNKKGRAVLNPVGELSRTRRWLAYWFMGLSAMTFYFIAEAGLRGGVSFIYRGF